MVVSLLGCTGLAAVDRNYSFVRQGDGVDIKEATSIAAKRLKDLGEHKNYNIGSGQVVLGKKTSCLTNYWFVTFDRAQFMNIFEVYYFIIEKHDGQIVKEGSNWLYAKSGMVEMTISGFDECK
jgi:hypothetical protein